MKYGREYKELLASEEFPAEWVSSAISYRELKKCIKKVQQELHSVGLDAETLQHLPSVFGTSSPPEEQHEIGVQSPSFVPALWVAVDKHSGSFIDAGLTAGTREHLRGLSQYDPDESIMPANGLDPNSLAAQIEKRPSMEAEIRWVHIPLSTATTFFNMLDPKLAQLDALQQAEEDRLKSMILSLGASIEQLTQPRTKKRGSSYKSQPDTEVWREILAMYIDSTVFFSSHEQDHGSRTFYKAKAQLQSFSDKLVKQNLPSKFKHNASTAAFDTFISVNLDILKAMHFQEINNEAVRKILKKFDKRTALGASKAYQGLTLSGPFAKSIATDMCAAISSKVVAIVPQMDDFICPICYGLAWRPIRLGCCSAIFCIRCVIQLQKDGEDRCPMCRQPSIMRATAANIDDNTAAYLQKYFPEEVKQRQKANERATAIDMYGEEFYKTSCTIM